MRKTVDGIGEGHHPQSAPPYLPAHHPKQQRIEKLLEWSWRTPVTAGGMGRSHGEGLLLRRRARVDLFSLSVT
jgi:hypothetical protein